MTKITASPLLKLIRRVVEDPRFTKRTDQELLSGFREDRDEAAFHGLVQRHGAMVLDVCRNVLGNEADAEDAFQATFLVLAQKAGNIRKEASVGSWLYGVALRIARNAQSKSAKRHRHESRWSNQRSMEAPNDLTWREVQQILYAELSRISEGYRAPLVLCYLEGKTQDEAAAALGASKATVKKRLERGRSLLRVRLVRRGLGSVAVLLAASWPAATASAPPAPALASSTVKAATLIAAGQAAAAVVPARVAALTEGMVRTMSLTKLKAVAALIVAVAILVTLVSQVSPLLLAQDAGPTKEQAAPAAAAKPADSGAARATRLGQAAHAQAAAIGKLPRFSYQMRYRYGVVDSLRAVDLSLEALQQGMTGPVRADDWIGRYDHDLSWDGKHLIDEMKPGESTLNYSIKLGTKEESWHRMEDKARTSLQFVRMGRPQEEVWDVPEHPMGSRIALFDCCYLRLTPHEFWWGRTVNRTCHTMSFIPLDKSSWKHLGTEQFGGETCDVVESTQTQTGEPGQRLWISEASGRVRGVLSYMANARTNELAQFDDYRAVSPGVWLPFREVRTFPHSSDVPRKHKIHRSELEVVAARTDRDLAQHYASILPKDGDRVQDQRFAAAVDLDYRAAQTDDEIRKLADAKYREQLKGQAEFDRMIQPLVAMVGKPAPALPEEGWLGGKRPDVAGKLYLIHFWATWCGPCKGDLPLLKILAAKGVIVVGMHPPGTPAEEVEKVICDKQLGYPTLLEPGKNAKEPRVGGYPVGVFPYCVLVDAQGRVAGHGLLSEVLKAFEGKPLDRPAPAD